MRTFWCSGLILKPIPGRVGVCCAPDGTVCSPRGFACRNRPMITCFASRNASAMPLRPLRGISWKIRFVQAFVNSPKHGAFPERFFQGIRRWTFASPIFGIFFGKFIIVLRRKTERSRTHCSRTHCSRTRERVEQRARPPVQNLTISATRERVEKNSAGAPAAAEDHQRRQRARQKCPGRWLGDGCVVQEDIIALHVP
jgi:hypothetical protein